MEIYWKTIDFHDLSACIAGVGYLYAIFLKAKITNKR